MIHQLCSNSELARAVSALTYCSAVCFKTANADERSSLSEAVPLNPAVTVAIKRSLLLHPSCDPKNQHTSEIACRACFGLKLAKRQTD